MNGYGEFKWKDGKTYVGEYKNDKKDGFGIYYWKEPNPKAYIGFWKNGKHDGIGKYITKEKSRIGLWNKGEKVRWFNNYNEGKIYLTKENKKYSHYFDYNLLQIKRLINE